MLKSVERKGEGLIDENEERINERFQAWRKQRQLDVAAREEAQQLAADAAVKAAQQIRSELEMARSAVSEEAETQRQAAAEEAAKKKKKKRRGAASAVARATRPRR